MKGKRKHGAKSSRKMSKPAGASIPSLRKPARRLSDEPRSASSGALLQGDDAQAMRVSRARDFKRLFAASRNALMGAKRWATSRFLSAARPVAGIAAMSATSAPQSNVVGVGIGRKIEEGEPTNIVCVRLYVVRKIAVAAIPEEHIIPPEIDGVPTDVIESGLIRAQQIPIARTRLRPARGGCSIGFEFAAGPTEGLVMAGTFGALVSRGVSRYILSNSHVLANSGFLPVGSSIYQPGLLDGGNPGADAIARLAKFIPFELPPNTNSVDAALAELLAPALATSQFLPSVNGLASPIPAVAVVGMDVHKHGRTTGYTTGSVDDVSADIKVRYQDAQGNSFNVLFSDQMAIRPSAGMIQFSAGGDSGSLIVQRDADRAVGLLFAGSPVLTFANQIDKVLTELQVTLLP